jgi:antitoxin component YwqK of YwqJK toxin-antitoxin module
MRHLLIPFLLLSAFNSFSQEVKKEYNAAGQLTATITYEEGVREGPCSYYWANGQLWGKGNFQNGRQEGLWLTYYENGQLKSSGSFIAGQKEGLWRVYAEEGHLSSTHYYKGGKEDFEKAKYYDAHGKEIVFPAGGDC